MAIAYIVMSDLLFSWFHTIVCALVGADTSVLIIYERYSEWAMIIVYFNRCFDLAQKGGLYYLVLAINVVSLERHYIVWISHYLLSL